MFIDMGGVKLAWQIFSGRNLNHRAESLPKRALAMALSAAAMLGSIMAALVQFAFNETGLADLTSANYLIGITALIFMLLITAGHVVGAASSILPPLRNMPNKKEWP